MTDYTANFAAPRRPRREPSPLAADVTLLVASLTRVPFLVRRTRPMTGVRRGAYLAAPLVGMSLGAAIATSRDGAPARDEIGDVLPSVAAMAVIGVAGAAAEVAIYKTIVGDRPRLTVKRAVALCLTRAAVVVIRRRVDAAFSSRYNPTKRRLHRIIAEQTTATATKDDQ